MSSLALVRLLQLASPALPVGAYSYSQALEWVIDQGQVRDEASATAWIGDTLELTVSRYEAPMLRRLLAAWCDDDAVLVATLNADLIASRDTAELRAESLQMGHSATRLIAELPGVDDLRRTRLAQLGEVAFPTAWACAAGAWGVPARDAIAGYLWSWLENQVMAAIKAVPLGQTAGQRMLATLAARIPDVVDDAMTMADEDLSSAAPALAIASCRHETQYSRLFRS